MALPVLDGNQTATTLSSVVTGGEHIVAHSVVSLGANAIANITSAVSGSVVSVSNFPASQSTTFGAVTGSVSVLNFPSTQTVAGTVTANVSSIFGETDQSQFATNFGDNFAQGVLNFGSLAVSQQGPISGTVTVGNSVTIGSLPAISGTVAASNLPLATDGSGDPIEVGVPIAFYDLAADTKRVVGDYQPLPVEINPEGNIPQISGTVTANVIGLNYSNGQAPVQLPLREDFDGTPFVLVGPSSSPEPFPISGTVTANNPSGALTTRFGSVTTANTAQITSAVTNTSRKYLLAQNISAGTVTIGIGFSPTTTQGIQLTAGGGLTFDAFCPTGAVYWLGAVTGAAFTILEG